MVSTKRSHTQIEQFCSSLGVDTFISKTETVYIILEHVNYFSAINSLSVKSYSKSRLALTVDRAVHYRHEIGEIIRSKTRSLEGLD
jgi:hypothetical protein